METFLLKTYTHELFIEKHSIAGVFLGKWFYTYHHFADSFSGTIRLQAKTKE